MDTEKKVCSPELHMIKAPRFLRREKLLFLQRICEGRINIKIFKCSNDELISINDPANTHEITITVRTE